ncbi:MAG: hypothetical protein ACRDTC_08470 [Pseudonocardiaceae bacterium]
MRDFDIWLGDAARALRILEVPPDPAGDATGAAVLSVLGLGLEVPEAGVPEPGELPGPPAPAPGYPTGSPVQPPPSIASNPAPQPHFVRELEPEPDTGPWPNPWASVAPLTRSTGPPPRLTLPALLPLPAARHILPAAVATSRSGWCLDAPAAVAALARGQILRTLPYRPMRTPRRGVQVLIDQGVGLEPFRHDVRQLVALLRSVVGASLVKVVPFVDLPESASASVIGRVPYRPPDPGTPVLAVTDLGISGRVPVAASAVHRAWRGLADLLRDRDSPLIALVPYPSQRWPASRSRLVVGTAAETDAELVAAFAARQPGVIELAELLSPAVQVEPALLRQVRLAAAPHLDVGTEADLWSSPLLRASGRHGFSFNLPIAAVLRDRLSRRWHDLEHRSAVEQAREVMAAVHAGSPPPLQLEEQVAWHVVTGDLDRCEAALAPAVAALTTGPDSCLEFWAGQAAVRLPAAARATTSGWVLSQLGGTPAPPPEDLLGLPVEHALRALPTDRLLVRRNLDMIELGTLTGPGVVAIRVPRTRPYLLELSWWEGSTSVLLGVAERAEVRIGTGPVWLRTVTGVRFQLDVVAAVTKNPAPACVHVPEGDRTGFFVAPDLIVTAARHGPKPDSVVWQGRSYPVTVASETGDIQVLRLIQPIADLPVLSVDPTVPFPWSRSSERWIGALATAEGRIRSITGSFEAAEPPYRLSIPAADFAYAEGFGVPVLFQGRLVGMISSYSSVTVHVVDVHQIAEVLAQVPSRSHALQLLESESWSYTVSDEDLTGGTLWLVRRIGTTEDTYTLAGRIRYFLGKAQESFPPNIVNEVLRQIAPVGNIELLLSRVTMLTDDDVHLLERHVAYCRTSADDPATKVTAADAHHLINLQQAISLELHTGFRNLDTDRNDVHAAVVAALGSDVFDITVRSYAEWGIRDCGDPVLTPHWINTAAHYGLSSRSTLPGVLRVAARAAIESAGPSQIRSVRGSASERSARALERFGLKVSDSVWTDDFVVEGSDAAFRAALTQLTRISDDNLDTYGSISAVTSPQAPYSSDTADSVHLMNAFLAALLPQYSPIRSRFGLALDTRWREFRDRLTAAGVNGFGPELDLFGFIDGFQKLLAIGLDAAARRIPVPDYRMGFSVRPDTARWLAKHCPFAIEQEPSSRPEVSLRLPLARLAALFAWAAPRLTASLRAAAAEREYRERHPAYRTIVVASGHLIDAPDRKELRFPPHAEPAVTAQIRQLLERWSIGSRDLVVTGGARGADLIAAEQALARGANVTLLLAFPPEEFIERSVILPDSDWSARFEAVRERATTLVATEVFGPAGEESPYVRTNRWLLDHAQALDVPMRAIAVWDGRTGDKAGGTADFVAQARRREVAVTVVNPSGTVEMS